MRNQTTELYNIIDLILLRIYIYRKNNNFEKAKGSITVIKSLIVISEYIQRKKERKILL